MKTKMSGPSVSILTSYFKGEEFLLKFLDNLVSQDMFSKLELVLDINEPSISELKILKEFRSQFPGVLNLSINESVVPMSVSLNNCILRAKANYLCIWNIDDRRTTNSISSQYDLISNSEKINTVYGPYVITSDYKYDSGKLIDNSKNPDYQFTRSMLLGPFFMFRKSLIEKIGYFDEQFYSAADFDFAVRLAFIGGLKSTQNLLGYFLDNQSGLSTNKNSIGPIERSIIQLRYGIIGLFNVTYIPYIANYVIPKIKFRNEWIPIENIVQDYEKIKLREISRTPKSNNSLARQIIAIFRRLFSQ